MDPKIGDAFGIDSNHRQLPDTGLGTRDESHAAFCDHASQVVQTFDAPVDVHFHEEARYGSTDSHLSRNRWQNQVNVGRILQVSKSFSVFSIKTLSVLVG